MKIKSNKAPWNTITILLFILLAVWIPYFLGYYSFKLALITLFSIVIGSVAGEFTIKKILPK